jgi:PEP-CTERM motif
MKPSTLLLAAVSACVASSVANANIRYYLDTTVGSDQVTGDIVTNGTLGRDVTDDVVGWTLTLTSSVYGSFTLSSASGNSTYQTQGVTPGSGFSATAKELRFNFSNGGYPYFQGSNARGQFVLCFQSQTNGCQVGPPGEGILVDDIRVPKGQLAPMSGIQPIASSIRKSLPAMGTAAAAAVPEPSTWAMMLLSFVGLGFARCRRTRSRAVAAPAA